MDNLTVSFPGYANSSENLAFSTHMTKMRHIFLQRFFEIYCARMYDNIFFIFRRNMTRDVRVANKSGIESRTRYPNPLALAVHNSEK